MMRTRLDGDVKAALSSTGTCQEETRASMRNLTATICLTIAILLGSGGIGHSDILKAGKAAEESFKAGAVAYEKRDYATALREWKQLADQGYAEAQNNLGWMYDNGEGVPQDYKTAAEWYKRAGEQGNAHAQSNLGIMYYNGKGVPQDYRTAAEWFERAVEQGNVHAQFNLGIMYYNGKGVPQNYKIADNGTDVLPNKDARYNLAQMYVGEGVPQNYKIAEEWYKRAADQGTRTTEKAFHRTIRLRRSGSDVLPNCRCPVQSGSNVRQRRRRSTG